MALIYSSQDNYHSYDMNNKSFNTMNQVSSSPIRSDNHMDMHLYSKVEGLRQNVSNLVQEKRQVESKYARHTRFLQEKFSEREKSLKSKLLQVELELESERSIRRDLEINFDKMRTVCQSAKDRIIEDQNEKKVLLENYSKLNNYVESLKNLVSEYHLIEAHLRDECRSLNIEIELLRNQLQETESLLDITSETSQFDIIYKIFQVVTYHINSVNMTHDPPNSFLYDILYILYKFVPTNFYMKYNVIPSDIFPSRLLNGNNILVDCSSCLKCEQHSHSCQDFQDKVNIYSNSLESKLSLSNDNSTKESNCLDSKFEVDWPGLKDNNTLIFSTDTLKSDDNDEKCYVKTLRASSNCSCESDELSTMTPSSSTLDEVIYTNTESHIHAPQSSDLVLRTNISLPSVSLSEYQTNTVQPQISQNNFNFNSNLDREPDQKLELALDSMQHSTCHNSLSEFQIENLEAKPSQNKVFKNKLKKEFHFKKNSILNKIIRKSKYDHLSLEERYPVIHKHTFQKRHKISSTIRRVNNAELNLT